nr:hyaluronate lyase [Desulfurococcales archaeon]
GPTRTGGVCIGCTMPGFTDAFEPFYKPLNAPQKPSMETLAAGAGAAALIGAAAAAVMDRASLGKPEKDEKEEG